MKRIVLLLISLTALLSCSVKGSLNLEADGAGSMDMSFTLAPYFGDFFNDLADADQLVAETDKSMKENPAVTSHTIDSSEKSSGMRQPYSVMAWMMPGMARSFITAIAVSAGFSSSSSWHTR